MKKTLTDELLEKMESLSDYCVSNEMKIIEKSLLQIIIKLLKYPDSKVCKHAVALDLINMMIKNNLLKTLQDKTIKDILSSNDEESINQLQVIMDAV
jgi:hypothetical protein